jgi:hypothetical protein
MVYVPVWPAVKLPLCDLLIASAGLTIVVGSLAVGEFVAPPPDALAPFVSGDVAFAATLTVRVIGFPLAVTAIAVVLVQVAVCPLPAHVQPVPLAVLYVRPVGSVSVTVIVPEVATLPEFPTSSVYVPVCPAPRFPVCDFASVRTELPLMLVGSVATGVLLAPPPDALAEFVTWPDGPTTLTASVIELPVLPAAIAVELVQVAVWPLPLQLQPVPLAALYVSPVGSVSVMVTVPEVATLPLLLTTIAYDPV